MKRVAINEEACIGCGACQSLAPDVFELNDEGLAEVIQSDITEALEEDVQDAVEGCPTEAIYYKEDEVK